MIAPATARDREQAARVLSTATLRAADELGMTQRELAAALGVSESSVSRLARGRPLPADTKEGELALLLIRVFRSLDALVGADRERVRAWFRAENAHVGGVPAERVRTIQGLVHVVEYLDALRGKS